MLAHTFSQHATLDSYEKFLSDFSIDIDTFFEWGINSTIFPSLDAVGESWERHKWKIMNNQTVYIRGYGRDAHGTQLYIDLYRDLFGNCNIKKDPTNNAQPHKHIQTLTGLKRNNDIFNYQVSHIWGRTKNIYLFEAPWNICYVPKIMDPFTGHETKGKWPEKYQDLFLSKANAMYKPFVDDYNELLEKYDIRRRTKNYIESLRNTISDKELEQFAKDALNELSAIS